MTNLNITGLALGTYNFKVACTDNATNTGVSAIYNFIYYVDSIKPVVTVNASILNNTVLSVPYYNIPYNFTDKDSGTANCSIYLNDVFNVSNPSVTNNTMSNLNITGLTLGAYIFKVACTDNASNTGVSAIYNFNYSDTGIPIVSIASTVQNNSYVTASSYSITFNYTDAISATASCSLWLNGTQNVTNAATVNNTMTSLTIPNLANGIYYWNVSCTDTSSNIGWSVGRYYFTKYTPSLIIYDPADFNVSRNPLIATFNYTDVPGAISCGLNVNGVEVNKLNGTIERYVFLQNSGYSYSSDGDGTIINVSYFNDGNNATYAVLRTLNVGSVTLRYN
jgi:hypothetical protein